jgi:hypothetical protein
LENGGRREALTVLGAAMAGKTQNASGSERLRMDGELGKHEDVSSHQLDCLVEDGRRQSGL